MAVGRERYSGTEEGLEQSRAEQSRLEMTAASARKEGQREFGMGESSPVVLVPRPPSRQTTRVHLPYSFFGQSHGTILV